MQEYSLKEIQDLQFEVLVCFDQFCKNNNLRYYLIAGSLLGSVRNKGFIPWDDDIDVAMFRNDYDKFTRLCSAFDKRFKIENHLICNNVDHALTRILIPDTKIEKGYLHKTVSDKLYFDIFPLDNVPDDMELRHKQAKKIARYKKILEYKLCKMQKNGFIKRIMKISRSYLYSFFSYKRLFSRLSDEMQRFNNTECKCVCSMASQYSYDKQTMEKSVYGEPKLTEFNGKMFFSVNHPNVYLSRLYGNDYMQEPPINKRRKPSKVFKVNDK